MLKQSVKDKLEQLKLKGFLRTAETSLDQMLTQGINFEEFLDFCLEAELNDRKNRRIERLFSVAKFRYPTARLEHIDYASERKIKKADIARYANCEWISDCRGLIISGATGVGKSWLACALGAEACHRSYSAMYFNAISLFDEISSAITLGEIKDFKKKVCSTKLLIIDDFGLGGFNQSLAPSFLEIIDKQSQNGGLLITSQVPKRLWFEQFQDPTIADAVMDRILHRSYELEISGRSYREKIYAQ